MPVVCPDCGLAVAQVNITRMEPTICTTYEDGWRDAIEETAKLIRLYVDDHSDDPAFHAVAPVLHRLPDVVRALHKSPACARAPQSNRELVRCKDVE